MHVNVFEKHRSLVDQDPNSQREPAESHNVDGLAVAHNATTAMSSANGIVMTTISELRQSEERKAT